MALGGFLVRDERSDRVVLVDAGVGNITAGPFVGGELLRSLAALGVQPEDVTDVLFTHLHFDHVGWATQQGEIVFPNATYRCDERDWSHFVGPDPGATKKLEPIVGVGAESAPLRDDVGPSVGLAHPIAEFAPATRDGFFLVPRLATHDDAGES